MNREEDDLCNKCAFIIVTYNSIKDIKHCINSIKNFHPECGIYIVDNNSTDGTGEILKSIERIHLEILPVNSGFSGGNNLAIKQAIKDGYKYFFLFNPDSRLTEKIIGSLIHLSNKRKAIVGPIIKDFHTGKVQSIGGTFNPFFSHFYITQEKTNYSDKPFKKVSWILGAAFLLSESIIKKCGYLDENFFPACYEDSTYCLEAQKKGVESFINLKTSILHKGGTSSGGESKYLMRILKNRFYFALKYQNILFFITTVAEISLRYFYHRLFGKLKTKR